MSAITQRNWYGVQADAYMDGDTVSHLVLWDGASPQPMLCVRASAHGGLATFALVANDDIPAQLKRTSVFDLRAEVQYDENAQGSVSAVVLYRRGENSPVFAMGNPSQVETQDVGFGVCSITIDLPAWVNDGMDSHEENALKDALLSIGGTSSVTLYAGGTLEISEPEKLQAIQRAVERVCREHAKNPPAQGAEALPFMMCVDGRVKVFDGTSGAELDASWSGICTAVEDVKALWLLGWDQGERSFTKLRSTTREAALQEVRGHLPGDASETEEVRALAAGVEDWRYGANKGAIYRFPEEGGVAAGYEWVASANRELVGLPEDQAAQERLAWRLADCANACRGMRDPMEEVAALRTAALRPRVQQASHDLRPTEQPGNDGPDGP